MLKTATIMRPVGCKQCRKGHSGRVGVYEVVKVTREIAAAILNGANVHELEVAAREAGFYDLRRAALKKCAAGLISLEEVNRVTVD
jgi:type IV pilus assembly protein PilB